MDAGANRAVEDLALEARDEPLRVRLVFESLNGTLDGSRIRIQHGTTTVLIDRTDR